MRKFASILIIFFTLIIFTIKVSAQQYTGFQSSPQPKDSAKSNSSVSSTNDLSATINQLSSQNKAKLQKKIDDNVGKVAPPPPFVASTPQDTIQVGSSPQKQSQPTTTSMPTPAVIAPPPTTTMPRPGTNAAAPSSLQQRDVYTGFGSTNKPSGNNTGTKNQGWNIRY